MYKRALYILLVFLLIVSLCVCGLCVHSLVQWGLNRNLACVYIVPALLAAVLFLISVIQYNKNQKRALIIAATAIVVPLLSVCIFICL